METDEATLPIGQSVKNMGLKMSAHSDTAVFNGHQSLSHDTHSQDENDHQNHASDNVDNIQTPGDLGKCQPTDRDLIAMNGDQKTSLSSSTNTKDNSFGLDKAEPLHDSNRSSTEIAMDTTEVQPSTLESPISTSTPAITNIEAIGKGSFFGVLTATTPLASGAQPNDLPDTQSIKDKLPAEGDKVSSDEPMESSEKPDNSQITEDSIMAEKTGDDKEMEISKEGDVKPDSTLTLDINNEKRVTDNLGLSEVKTAVPLKNVKSAELSTSDNTEVTPLNNDEVTRSTDFVMQTKDLEILKSKDNEIMQLENDKMELKDEEGTQSENNKMESKDEEGTQSENDKMESKDVKGAQSENDKMESKNDEVIELRKTDVLLSNVSGGEQQKPTEVTESSSVNSSQTTITLSDAGKSNTNGSDPTLKTSTVSDEVVLHSTDEVKSSTAPSCSASLAETVKPTDAKSIFRIKPPATESSKAVKSDGPSAQDIKDGHAYLRPTPKFLYQLGLSMLREVVYEGLADHVGGLRKKGDKKYSEEQFESLQKSLVNLRKENQHLKLANDKKCQAEIDGRPCRFKTESDLVLETHLSQAHINRSNRYVCARCSHHTPHMTVFRSHMLEKHGLEGVVDKPLPFYPCKLCFYETNIAVRMQSHQNNCTKSFQIGTNLKPTECDKTPVGEDIFKKVISVVKSKAPPLVTVKSPATSVVRHPGIIPSQSVQKIPATIRPAMVGTGTLQQIKINSHVIIPQKAVVTQAAPIVQQVGGAASGVEVLQCEICGGYIQGLQALRVHMQWTHNINIAHISKPQFQCVNASCRKIFWTVQGLGKHSSACTASVTPQVKVPLNPSCCFICSKPYQTSQVEHLLGKHLNDLKKMVEIKKCFAPRCAPFLFGSVENLQFHLAKEHRLKMTGLSGLATANANNIKFQPFCSICKLKFGSSTEFARHCAEKHVHKCDLCGAQCSTQKGLQEHEAQVHPLRFCLACDKPVKRTNFDRHVTTVHQVDKCTPRLKRLSDEEYQEYAKKPKLDNWS